MSSRLTRIETAKLIASVLAGRSLNTCLPQALKRLPLQAQPQCQEWIYSCLRELPKWQGILRQLLQKPLKSKDYDVLGLIIIGLHQLKDANSADHAAISETVESIKTLKKVWAKGLVNAVLREYQRNHETLERQLSPAEEAGLSPWMYEVFAEQWPSALADIIAAARSRPPLTLRVNGRLGTPKQYLDRCHDGAIEARAEPAPAEAITLSVATSVGNIVGFAEGSVSVQDRSAQFAAHYLAPQRGERILDACAAPGGKVCHIGEMQTELSALVAWDISSERIERVRENQARLGLALETQVVDATAAHPEGRLFDAILVDAPCSASGVLRRNPDVKTLRQREDLDYFVDQQRALLENLWAWLAPGGRLLYATCSIFKQENDGVVAWSLDHLSGARSIALPLLGDAQATKYGVQHLPSAAGGDGLYYALLHKPN